MEESSTKRAWPQTEIHHRGIATAKFSDPKGWVRGPVTVSVDEQGELDFEMRVEECRLEEESHGHSETTILLSGHRPQPTGDGMAMRYSLQPQNICESFEVATEHGVFRTESPVLYSSDLGDVRPRLRVHPLWAQFDAGGIQGPTRYWAMPLSNFLTSLSRDDLWSSTDVPDLGTHPLRVRNVVGQDHSARDAGLIPFEFGGRAGFIEPLVDYRERAEELHTGRARSRVTAVMVGETGGEDCSHLETVESWFPFFLFEVLSLATGSEIGSPWIEFRDADTRLVRRIYTRAGAPLYIPGHRAVDQALHQGIGALITRTLRPPGSTELRKSYLRACIKHAVRAKLAYAPLEERLAHVFRAADTLCEHFELKKGPDPKKLVRQDIHAELPVVC